MRKNRFYIGVCLVGLLSTNAYTHVRKAKSERDFKKIVSNAPFAVVMLCNEDKEIRKQKTEREQFDDIQRVFRSASTYSTDFKYADVVFLQVNVSRRDNIFIAQQYSLDSYPTFLLFKDGHPVIDKTTKKPAQLTGFVTRTQLVSFIDNYLKSDIKKAAKEGKKRRSYYNSGEPYFSVGVGYPYPYYAPYYYPYYPYYAPFYGYPYYGGYPYGPGFGISIGF